MALVRDVQLRGRGAMASKKLSPKARHIANPKVRVSETNPARADERYETDARGPADQDGNAEHARKLDAPDGNAGRGKPAPR
jgi:hypothetical protein